MFPKKIPVQSAASVYCPKVRKTSMSSVRSTLTGICVNVLVRFFGQTIGFTPFVRGNTILVINPETHSVMVVHFHSLAQVKVGVFRYTSQESGEAIRSAYVLVRDDLKSFVCKVDPASGVNVNLPTVRKDSSLRIEIWGGHGLGRRYTAS